MALGESTGGQPLVVPAYPRRRRRPKPPPPMSDKGGKPNPGTPADMRLRENRRRKKRIKPPPSMPKKDQP